MTEREAFWRDVKQNADASLQEISAHFWMMAIVVGRAEVIKHPVVTLARRGRIAGGWPSSPDPHPRESLKSQDNYGD